MKRASGTVQGGEELSGECCKDINSDGTCNCIILEVAVHGHK